MGEMFSVVVSKSLMLLVCALKWRALTAAAAAATEAGPF